MKWICMGWAIIWKKHGARQSLFVWGSVRVSNSSANMLGFSRLVFMNDPVLRIGGRIAKFLICDWLRAAILVCETRPSTVEYSRPENLFNWPLPVRGPTRLRAWVRNRDQLENRESRGPENGVSRWRRPNSDIYSQNHHFGLVYDMIYQFLGTDAKNYTFAMFSQQCHPSVASGDAVIRLRNASRIHTRHLFTS